MFGLDGLWETKKIGQKFLEIAHKFIYRYKLEYGSLIEIARLRERMEKELTGDLKKERISRKDTGTWRISNSPSRFFNSCTVIGLLNCAREIKTALTLKAIA